jgi:phenylalanyl-tRNA synthetase beta subunit
MEKLGFTKAAADKAAADNAAAVAKYVGKGSSTAAAAAAAAAAAKPVAISPVDVVKKLDALAAKNSQKLDWKVSIVDLMKLLGLDSSLQARKELATELGCPVDKMGDSAAMNTWLHKTVLRKLAENGGNIPRELL